VVLFAELFAEGDRVAWRSPSHVRDFFHRAEVRFGVTMAVQTPAHAEWLVLVDLFHLVHPTVTTHSANAAGHVGAMVEVSVVRQVVNLHPLDGLAGRVALADQRKLGAIRPNLGVAVHARLGRGNGGVRAVLDRVVAVPAVDAQLTRMQRVAVRDRLFGHVADIRRFGRSAVPDERDQINGRDPEHYSSYLSCLVGPAREYEQIHHQKPWLVARASPSAERIRGEEGSIGEAETGSDGSLHPRANDRAAWVCPWCRKERTGPTPTEDNLRLRVRAYALAFLKCKEKLAFGPSNGS